MAATREKRSNAGAKMAKLLEDEDEDDFYKTTYGGFEEEVNDDSFDSDQESGSDISDSDIDFSENDEVRSDMEDDEPKRQKRVVTKAYKEPVKKKLKTNEKAETKPTEKKPKATKTKTKSTVQMYHCPSERKALRRSTAQKSQEIQKKVKEREVRKQHMKDIAAKKNVPSVRRLTQEELLAEAELTEEINLKSLDDYRRLELEKKKSRTQKQTYRGPIVRHHSMTMPLIEELPSDVNIDVDGSNETNKAQVVSKSADKCARTFITFTDEKNFKEVFNYKKTRPPTKQYCPITRLPAKYFDPVTLTPYANVQAFKCIRDKYFQLQEQHCSKKLSDLNAMLEKKKKLQQ